MYQDVNGQGVWANEYKLDHGQYVLDHGSDGISGGGPHGKEELIFTFDHPAVLDTISVGLIGLNYSKDQTEWKDDPIFFITGSAGNELDVSEATLLSIFHSTGKDMGYVNFSDFARLTDPNETVSYFRTRNLEEHFEVNFLRYEIAPSPPVPEPASVTMWALGAMGLMLGRAIRRRRVNQRERGTVGFSGEG